MKTFENKVAFVTGAAGGIGLATAIAFAQTGAAVALADIDAEAARQAADALAGEGHRVIGIRCDVTDEASVAGAVDRTVAELGGLHAAYNNAGLHAPSVETADALAADFDKVIAVNLKGVWLCMKHQLRHMRGAGGGAIVNCSSQSGLAGIAGLGAYTASKHGVIGLQGRQERARPPRRASATPIMVVSRRRSISLCRPSASAGTTRPASSSCVSCWQVCSIGIRMCRSFSAIGAN